MQFNSATAKAAGSHPKPQRKSQLSQALDLQSGLHSLAAQLFAEIPATSDPDQRARLATAAANAAKAWQLVRNQLRIMRGEPLPGSLKPSAEKKRKEKYWDEATEKSIQEPEQVTKDTSQPTSAS